MSEKILDTIVTLTNVIENLKNALEILNHHFTIEKLKVENGYLYFLNVGDTDFGISKEEFELLEKVKEVLE